MSQPKKSLFGLNNTQYPAPVPDAAKIAAACLVTVVAELILVAFSKFYSRSGSFAFVRGLTLVLAIAFAAGFVYFVISMIRSGGKPEDLRLYTALAVACLGLAASFLIMRLYWLSGIKILYVLWAAAGVLYVINQIYHREFVFLAGLTGLGAVVAFINYHLMGYESSATPLVATVVLIAAGAGIAVLTFLAGRSNGVAPFFGQDMTVFVIPSSKVLLYVTCLVTILCALAGSVLGAAFCYYCFFVALAWLILSAAYYTIRLM